MLELIPRFHPVYDGVEAKLLLEVDDHLAHDNLRDWASFTQTAAKLCAEHDQPRLDRRITANAFALHGGIAPTRTRRLSPPRSAWPPQSSPVATRA